MRHKESEIFHRAKGHSDNTQQSNKITVCLSTQFLLTRTSKSLLVMQNVPLTNSVSILPTLSQQKAVWKGTESRRQ